MSYYANDDALKPTIGQQGVRIRIWWVSMTVRNSTYIHQEPDMSCQDDLQTIIDTLESAKDDADKFDQGNGSAGTRVRNAAMDGLKGLKNLRKSVQETKTARKGG